MDTTVRDRIPGTNPSPRRAVSALLASGPAPTHRASLRQCPRRLLRPTPAQAPPAGRPP